MELIAIGGVIGVVTLWIVAVQRGLVHREELCTNSLSQIGVQLSSRWDLVTAMARMVKQYAEHEYQTLTGVIGMRKDLDAGASVRDIEEQESLLGRLVGNIKVVSERYPTLKADHVYIETMGTMREFEENVRLSRMVYNDSVTRFNRFVRQIPNNFVAGMFGFRVYEYLREDTKKQDFPQV